MSNFSLNQELNITATAKLIAKGNDLPLTGAEYRVRLYDKDIFKDDFLGESQLDNNGVAQVTFNASSFGDFAKTDVAPDFYFVVLKAGNIIFKSKVMQDVKLESIEHFKSGQGNIIDLGTFLVQG